MKLFRKFKLTIIVISLSCFLQVCLQFWQIYIFNFVNQIILQPIFFLSISVFYFFQFFESFVFLLSLYFCRFLVLVLCVMHLLISEVCLSLCASVLLTCWPSPGTYITQTSGACHAWLNSICNQRNSGVLTWGQLTREVP